MHKRDGRRIRTNADDIGVSHGQITSLSPRNNKNSSEYDEPTVHQSISSASHRVHFQGEDRRQHVRSNNRNSNNISNGNNKIVNRVRGNYEKRYSKLSKLMLLKRHAEIGFGFSIRGGVEHGTGIFVSNLNKYSDASAQGLQVGDQILRANNSSFDGILHDEAVQYIQRQRVLRLIVLSLGVVPGSKMALVEYQWMDCYGQPCSPLETKRSLVRRGSSEIDNQFTTSMRLLSGEDERKVNVVVGNHSTLGLLIRGGSEYGLGVFIAGIDQNSVADQSGIMVGEQILEVNGIDFENISHTDAVHIIRTSKMMTMTLKDVGKVPLARVIHDKTEWLKKNSVRQSNVLQTKSSFKNKDSVFQQGITGGQLNHQSLASPVSFQWIEQKAHSHLNKDEWTTLKYYIREYIHQNLTVTELGISLLELLDTKEKMSLVDEVRGIIRPHDLEMFDELMLKTEVDAMTSLNNEDGNNNNIMVNADISPSLHRTEGLRNAYGHQSSSSPTKGSWRNTTNNMDNNFNYRHLTEESYHSTFDNLTEETTLATGSPPYSGKGNLEPFLLDETIPNGSNDKLEPLIEIEDEDDEPLYATVSRLTEYANHEQPAVLETFQSPPIGRKRGMRNIKRNKKLSNMYNKQGASLYAQNDNDEDDEDDAYDDTKGEKKEDTAATATVHDDDDDDDDDDFNSNSLGFAFSYLNSQENSPQTRPHHTKSEENIEMSPIHYRSPTHTPNKSGKLFRELHNDNMQNSNQQVIDYSQVKAKNATEHLLENTPSTHLEDLQPKYLAHRNSLDKNQRRKHHDIGRVLSVRDDNDNTDNARHDLMDNFVHTNQDVEDVEEQFDLSKTMDSHYSNFSVNDIKRQKFLPTTRVNPTILQDNNDNVNNSKSIDITANNKDETSHHQHISKVNSLNIQNQYQYQHSLSPINLFLPHQLSNTSLDDIKTYGKPVMAKSPRPSPRPLLNHAKSHLPPPPPPIPTPKSHNTPNTFFTRKPLLEDSLQSKSEEEENKQHDIPSSSSPNKTFKPEIQWFSMNRLKKTNNSIVLWEKGHQIEEVTFNGENGSPEISKTIFVDTDKLNSLGFIPKQSPRQNRSITDLKKSLREHSSEKLITPNLSPRISEYGDSELNILSSSQEGQYRASVRKFSVEQNTPVMNQQNILVNQQETPETMRKTQLKSWLQNDLRPTYKPEKSFNFNSDIVKPMKSNALQEKINVFSNPPVDSNEKASKQRQKVKNAKSLVERHPRVVRIPNNNDEEPGFEVDISTNNDTGQTDLYISEITNKSIKNILTIGDVITGIEDHVFKTNLKKGLVNLIIRNKFKSTDKDTIKVTLL